MQSMRMPTLTGSLRVRKLIYHLRGMPLPVPMTPPEFGLLAVCCVVAIVLLMNNIVTSPVQLLLIGGGIGLAVYFGRQRAIDGRTPLQFCWSLLRHWCSPSRMVGVRADVDGKRRIRIRAFVRHQETTR